MRLTEDKGLDTLDYQQGGLSQGFISTQGVLQEQWTAFVWAKTHNAKGMHLQSKSKCCCCCCSSGEGLCVGAVKVLLSFCGLSILDDGCFFLVAVGKMRLRLTVRSKGKDDESVSDLMRTNRPEAELKLDCRGSCDVFPCVYVKFSSSLFGNFQIEKWTCCVYRWV